MIIAIPTANETMCPHFGHCEQFYLFEVDKDKKTIENVIKLTPPPHEPGLLPRWLKEQNANLIIAGGMGMRAQSLFMQNGIEVITGASMKAPEELVKDYLEENLETGENTCDH
jgi:predicted Fe-Mo cluster-binding NifX family protein